MKKTAEEILESHYRNYKKRIPYSENVISAMKECASQEREGTEQLIERYKIKLIMVENPPKCSKIELERFRVKAGLAREFISELSKLLKPEL